MIWQRLCCQSAELGLTIAKSLVEMYKGEIGVRDRPDERNNTAERLL